MTEEADDEVDEDMNAPVVSHDLRAALDGMVASLRTKETAKRVAFKVPFVLGKDLSIGITGSVPPPSSRGLARLVLLTAALQDKTC